MLTDAKKTVKILVFILVEIKDELRIICLVRYPVP
jgi:hypothetical protein